MVRSRGRISKVFQPEVSASAIGPEGRTCTDSELTLEIKIERWKFLRDSKAMY